MIRSRLMAAALAVALPLTLAACGSGAEAPAQEAHGHGGGGIVVTHYAELTELFVEYRPLVVGKKRRSVFGQRRPQCLYHPSRFDPLLRLWHPLP